MTPGNPGNPVEMTLWTARPHPIAKLESLRVLARPHLYHLTDHLMPGIEGELRGPGSDEASGSGDEKFHRLVVRNIRDDFI